MRFESTSSDNVAFGSAVAWVIDGGIGDVTEAVRSEDGIVRVELVVGMVAEAEDVTMMLAVIASVASVDKREEETTLELVEEVVASERATQSEPVARRFTTAAGVPPCDLPSAFAVAGG
jgi:hypothetical protein